MSGKLDFRLIQLPPPEAAQDVPTRLRLIADEIERGDHGEVNNMALVTLGSDIWTFGLSGIGESAQMVEMFELGKLRFMMAAMKVYEIIER